MTMVGAQYQGSLFTPQTVKSEMVTIDRAVRQMVSDAANTPSLPQATRDALGSFAKEWYAFYKEHDSWIRRSLNTTFGKVQEFRDRVSAWQRKLRSAGVKTSAIALPKRRTGKDWIVPAIALAGGIGLALWLFK